MTTAISSRTQLPIGQTIEVLDHPISGNAGHPDTIERGPNYHPIDLGLKPISDYDYHVIHRNAIIRREYDSIEKTIRKAGLPMPSGDIILQMANERVEKVTKIIEDLKTGSTPCYFLNNSNPFVALVQPDGQIWWRSICGNIGPDVEQIVDHVTRRKQSIIINSGSHGGTDGSIVCDVDVRGDGYFFILDAMMLARQNPKVAVHQVERGRGPNYKETANHAIDAWCHSILGMFTSPTQLYSFDGTREPSDYRDVTGEVMTDPYHFPICGELSGRVHYYDSRTIQKLRRLLPDGTTTTVCRVYGCGKTINLLDAKPVMGLKQEIERFLSVKAQETAEKTERLAEIARLTGERDEGRTRIAHLEGKVAEDAQTITLQHRTITQTTAERDTARVERDTFRTERDTAQDTVKAQEAQINEAQVQVRQQAQEIQQLADRVDRLVFVNDGLLGNDTLDQRIAKSFQQSVKDHTWTIMDVKTTLRFQKESADAVLEHTFKGGIVHWMAPIYERRNAFVLDGYESCHEHITRVVADLFLNQRRVAVKDQTIWKMAFKSPNPKRGSSQAITFSYQENKKFSLL